MLNERRQKLLQFIIDEYVSTAQPVGSNTLVEKYGLPVSPATIRSEMSRLEEDGYITHPHTSAGRVPTDLGYRYYVEALMREEQVPGELQHTIRHQFHQAARELEEWAKLAAAIMAARLNNAAVVTTPHSPQPKLRWLELVGVHDYLALVVVVLQGGPCASADAGVGAAVYPGRADNGRPKAERADGRQTAAQMRGHRWN